MSKKVDFEKILKDESLSKSEKIRRLYVGGLSVSEISKLSGFRYQMCYNIIDDYCVKNGIEKKTSKKGESKSDVIVKLFKEGKSVKEIAYMTDSWPNYVYRVLKKKGLY
jgi:transposase